MAKIYCVKAPAFIRVIIRFFCKKKDSDFDTR